jgi:hypothetical protein
MSLRFFFLLTPRLLGTGKHDTTYTQKKKTSVHQKKEEKSDSPRTHANTHVFTATTIKEKKESVFVYPRRCNVKEGGKASCVFPLFVLR